MAGDLNRAAMWRVRYPYPNHPDADALGAVTDYVPDRAAAEELVDNIIGPNYGPEVIILPPVAERPAASRRDDAELADDDLEL